MTLPGKAVTIEELFTTKDTGINVRWLLCMDNEGHANPLDKLA